MILASVCRPWREIVEATPRLWTELPINLTLYAINPYLNFIDRWLSRSGGLGLTLAICGDAWAVASAADQQFLAPARSIELINTYSSRWEILDIYVSNCFLRQFRFSSRKEPMLKSLRIHARPGPLSYDDDPTFNTGTDTNSILHAKNVFLSRISPNSVGIAWNHVVRADISGITAFDYLSLLATSPKLISLRIWSLKDNEGQDTQSFGPHPVTHSALEILNLTTTQNIDALLNHVTLPSLQKLVANSLTTGLISMITRLAPPLTDVTIGNAESSGEVISLLKMMPNLNDLHLLDTQISTWFFQYLASTSTFSTSPLEDEDERFLPNLSSLKIRWQQTLLWSYVADLCGLEPNLNGQGVDGQTRVRRPLMKLSIEVALGGPTVVGYYKTELVDEETLRRLRTAGISLEICDYHGNCLMGTNGGESGKGGQR